jgi:hypothetical protein
LPVFCLPETCVVSTVADHTHYLAFFHTIVRPFKKAKGGFTHIFITVDKFRKCAEVTCVASMTAAKAVEFVREIMYRFGIPKNIITDNGERVASAWHVVNSPLVNLFTLGTLSSSSTTLVA